MSRHLLIIVALCGLLFASEMKNGAIRITFTSDQAAANREPSSVDLRKVLNGRTGPASAVEVGLRDNSDNSKHLPLKPYGNLDGIWNAGQRVLAECNHPNCIGPNSEHRSENVKSNGSPAVESSRLARPSRMDLLEEEQSKKYEQCKQMLLNLSNLKSQQQQQQQYSPGTDGNVPPTFNDFNNRVSGEDAPDVQPQEPNSRPAVESISFVSDRPNPNPTCLQTDQVLQPQLQKYKLSLSNILKDLGVVCANGTKLRGTSGLNLHIHLPYPACRQTRSLSSSEVARALVGETGLTLAYRTVSTLNPRDQRSVADSDRGDSDLEITLLNDSVVIPLNESRLEVTRNQSNVDNWSRLKAIGNQRKTQDKQPLNVDESQINGLLESLGNIIQSSTFIKQGKINLADDRTWAQVNNGSGHSHWGH